MKKKTLLSIVFVLSILACGLFFPACSCNGGPFTPKYDYSINLSITEDGIVKFKQPESYVKGDGTYFKYKALGNTKDAFLTWNNVPKVKEDKYYVMEFDVKSFGHYEVGQPYTIEVERYNVWLGYLNMIDYYKTYVNKNYGLDLENDFQFTIGEDGKFYSLSDYYADDVDTITTLYPLEECITIGGSLIANNAFIVKLKNGNQFEFEIPLNFTKQIKTGKAQTGTAEYKIGDKSFVHNYKVPTVSANVTSSKGDKKYYTINNIDIGNKQSVSIWDYYGTTPAVKNENHYVNYTAISESGLNSIKHVKQLACYINLKAGDLVGFNNLETLIMTTNGVKVAELFNGNIPESLKTVILYRSNSIPDYFFHGCTNLENVYMTGAVESVSEKAFEGLSGVENMIVSGKFKLDTTYLPTLQNLRVSYSTTKIADNFLYRNKYIKNVYMPDSVTEIGNYSFSYMESIQNLRISNALKHINIRAFERIYYFGDLHFSNVETVETYAFQSAKVRKVSFTERLTSVYSWIFYGCENLETLIMPSPDASFDGLSALIGETPVKELHINGKKKIHELYKNVNNKQQVLENIYKLEKLVVYGNICDDFAKDFKINNKTIEIVLDDSVKSIGSSAFENTNVFKSLNTNKVEKIYNYAFLNNLTLSEISTTTSLTYVGVRALDNSAYSAGKDMLIVGDGVLVKYSLASSVADLSNENIKYIMAGVFDKNLTEIKLGESVMAIEEDAFINASGLKILTLLSPNINIVNGDKYTELFYNSKSLTTIYVNLSDLSTYQNAKYWSDYSSKFAPL